MAIKKVLDRISDVLDKICGAICVLMIAAMVILTTLQIVFRTWFTALSWSDEVTRYLLVWSTFLGATCVYRHSGNISITFIQEAFPANISKVLRVAVHIVCFVLFVVLLYYGWQYVGSLNRTATSIPLKMSQVYLCMPISMLILMIHALVMIVDECVKEAKNA